MNQLYLTPEQGEKIFKAFVDQVSSIQDSDKRMSLLSVLEYFDDRLFLAPASGRVQYHNCFQGGLVEHSLRVLKNLRTLVSSFDTGNTIDNSSIVTCALFHDLGKVGDMTHDYYIPQESEWHQNKLGEYYTKNPDLLYMDTAARSLYLLGQFGVSLTPEEAQAILIHDGQYIEANRRYAQKECLLALLLHQADMIACKQEGERWKKFNGKSQ